jgi:hypothetical protein
VPHSRHSHAANGIDLLKVSGHLGLCIASTTLDAYTNMVSGTQENTAAVMDNISAPISLPPLLVAPMRLQRRGSEKRKS